MAHDAGAAAVMAETAWRVMRSPQWLAALGDDEERVALLIVALCDALGGPGAVYVPDGAAVRAALERRGRNARIRGAFDGTNYATLARRYGLSARQVRRIVDRPRRRK